MTVLEILCCCKTPLCAALSKGIPAEELATRLVTVPRLCGLAGLWLDQVLLGRLRVRNWSGRAPNVWHGRGYKIRGIIHLVARWPPYTAYVP